MKLTNGDHVTLEYCNGRKCVLIAKDQNGSHVAVENYKCCMFEDQS